MSNKSLSRLVWFIYYVHVYVLQALHYRKYSAASDIWSFGVLMYEIWSLGHSPFKQQSPEDVSEARKK